MYKVLCRLGLVISICISILGIGLAEDTVKIESKYREITSSVIFINDENNIEETGLTSSLYISDEEIWFSGTSASGKPWLICANIKSDVLFSMILNDAPGNYIYVKSLSKVGDALLLGIVDFETQLGTIGIMQDSHRGEVA